MKNEMSVSFSSLSVNESFARVAVGSFIAQLDPTMDELTEIKTVVSEAVTNSIIHGYHNDPNQQITITCNIRDEVVDLAIKDDGVGIGNIEEARQPLRSEEHTTELQSRGHLVCRLLLENINQLLLTS